MSSQYDIQNVRYTGTLSRPGSTKGNIYAHDGTKTFKLITPGTDGAVLTSNSASTGGVLWSSTVVGLGIGFNTPNCPFPALTTSNYYLVRGSATETFGMVLPVSMGIFWSIRPNANTGWATTPTNITGGTIDFNFGYVPANTRQIPANFVAYSGSPDVQISGSTINTVATKFKSPYATISPTVTAGQQFCIKVTNNLTVSADPLFTSNLNGTIIFHY